MAYLPPHWSSRHLDGHTQTQKYFKPTLSKLKPQGWERMDAGLPTIHRSPRHQPTLQGERQTNKMSLHRWGVRGTRTHHGPIPWWMFLEPITCETHINDDKNIIISTYYKRDTYPRKRKAEIKPPDSTYRNSMLVGSVDPSRGRHCDKWMWEIHKHIDQVPVPKMVSFHTQLPLNPFVLLIASFVVMAHKQLRPLRMPTVAIPQWNWTFEELQIWAGKISFLLQLFQSGEREGHGEAPFWMW